VTDAPPQHGHGSQAYVRVLIVTCSDTRTQATDESGQLVARLLQSAGHLVVDRVVVRDEPAEIEAVLQRMLEGAEVEAVVVSGGTGISSRDRTFDALDRLLEKRIDGFGELFRMLSYSEVGASAMLSRATAGLLKGRVIFSVPGSVNAVRLAVEKLILPVLGHAVREARR
jgi:molybdenum cofactor biosynthesis protein B